MLSVAIPISLYGGTLAKVLHMDMYRGTSLTKKRTPLGTYRMPMPRVLWGS